MATYLLLRSNRQTGPLEFDELIALGLKPYDLVWVEGKSAAWRYPGEVPELAPYAPLVEEQPYDRFYRKSGTEGPGEVASSGPVSSKQPETVLKPQRRIHVSIPVAPSPQAREAVRDVSETVPQPEPIPDRDTDAIRKTVEVSSMSGEGELYPHSSATGFPDEMRYGNPKIGQATRLRAGSSAFVAAVLFLIIGGAVTAIFWPASDTPDGLVLPASTVAEIAQSEKVPESPGNFVFPAEGIVEGTDDNEQTKKGIGTLVAATKSDVAVPSQREVYPAPPGNNNGEVTGTAEMSNPLQDTQAKFVTQPKLPETTVRRPAAPNAVLQAVENPREAAVAGYFKDVRLEKLDFTRGATGGLYDIRIHLHNAAPVTLNTVIVELQYIKANGEIWQTKQLTAENIAPGDSYVFRAPDSNRGVRMSATVSMVSTRDGLAYVTNPR